MSHTLNITRELKLALTGIALSGAVGGWYIWNLPPAEAAPAEVPAMTAPASPASPSTAAPSERGATVTAPAEGQGGTPPAPAPAATQTYTVKPDESLWLIGKAYGTDAQVLADLNGVNINTPLHVGQVLQLPSSAKRLPDPAPAESQHVDDAALPNLSGAAKPPSAPSPQALPNPFRAFDPVSTPGKPKAGTSPASVVLPLPVTPPTPAPVVSRLEPVTTPRISTAPHVALPPVPGLPTRPVTVAAPVTITPVTPTRATSAAKPPVPPVTVPTRLSVPQDPRTPAAPAEPTATRGAPQPIALPDPVNPVQQTIDDLHLTVSAVIVGAVNTALFDGTAGPMYLTAGQVVPGTDIEVRRISSTVVTLARGATEVHLIVTGGP
ncbi:LysM peptidoglycan-binding domain-containing protein [Deinococcus soli (ex Cha et al. 2016)]|uniref:LysM repeat protein n=2 Tax=Deinococcus soli (ex Cha et al. 2016) TaxID=1309411 RepID=A0ACC6KGE1_9DEIO|nr:LysM peptidoglycan-binding domain-containing protein [Deinococcus soli (ex Cha et al. 2016)]MDR6218527.1 LysM repeat protein [Deinococcus soli (ex Cha et al. 2016)]MDR6329267.1 LysM repeat protein [Deinococcus soli (ex Cha et al. 2016)]MDR6751540.1 LysM repeat protein [Deinococcus soli (ex Cha et al. 2016)]